jgi:hypothetical protein
LLGLEYIKRFCHFESVGGSQESSDGGQFFHRTKSGKSNLNLHPDQVFNLSQSRALAYSVSPSISNASGDGDYFGSSRLKIGFMKPGIWLRITNDILDASSAEWKRMALWFRTSKKYCYRTVCGETIPEGVKTHQIALDLDRAARSRLDTPSRQAAGHRCHETIVFKARRVLSSVDGDIHCEDAMLWICKERGEISYPTRRSLTDGNSL